MSETLEFLKNKLNSEGLISQNKISDRQISNFELMSGLVLPIDLATYFKCINGSNGEYEENFFCFYSFDQFNSIDKVYADWHGTPDYSKITSVLQNYETCFVIADYQCNLFAYAIKLYKQNQGINEVYVVCGDEYKIIANSFTEFVNLFQSNSIELML